MKATKNVKMAVIVATAAAGVAGVAATAYANTGGGTGAARVAASTKVGKTGASSKTGKAAATQAAARPARCHTADLALSLVRDTASRHHGGGMNHQGATLRLKNTSRHTCQVAGYPGAAMLTKKGKVIPPGLVVRGRTYYAADAGPHIITLRPGASAYGELGWTSADGSRPAVATASLIVTPPNERTHRTVALRTLLGGKRTITATALTATPARLAG